MKLRHSGLRALSLLIAPLALFPWTASAASHSKKQTKEVYAATDGSEMQPGFAMPVESETGANLEAAPAPAPVAAPKKAKARATASAASAPVIDTAPAIPTAKAVAPVAVKSAPQSSQSFDAVPASQKDAILERLTIVENLVRKYGRAYDYRTHTLKELQLIQSTLESTSTPAAAAQPAAAPARVRAQAPVVAVPAPVAAPAATSAEAPAESNDVIKTGQAAAVENSEDVNLKALPTPTDFGSQADADQEN